MVLKTVYHDSFGNVMECYPNADGRLCLTIRKQGLPEESAHIAVDSCEVSNLIKLLKFYHDLLNHGN